MFGIDSINNLRSHRKPGETIAVSFAFVLMCSIACVVSAAEWDGGGSNNNWSNPDNWKDGEVPGSDEDIKFDKKGNHTVVIDVEVTIKKLELSKGTITFTLNEDFTATDEWIIQNKADFTLESGSGKTLTVEKKFNLKNQASYTQNSGNVVIEEDAEMQNSGDFILNGGNFTINGDTLVKNNVDLDVNGGRLRVDGDFDVDNNPDLDVNDGGVISIGGTLDPDDSIDVHDGGVLPVTLDRFEARAVGAGVLVTWHVASEFQNAGFNLWRRTPGIEGTEWRRVNETLIPGRITAATPMAYRWFDWVEPGVYEYRIEDVSISGQRVTHHSQDTRTVVGESADFADADESIWGAVRESIEREVRSIRRARLVGQLSLAAKPAIGQKRVAAMKRPSVGSAANAVPPHVHPGVPVRKTDVAARAVQRVDHPYRAAKIVHADSGVLLVPHADLPSGYDADRVSIRRGGNEVPALAVAPEGLVLYAPGYRDRYTDRDVFFLCAKDSPTSAGHPTRAMGLFDAGVTAIGSERARETKRFEEIYFAWSLRPLSYQPWFSEKILTDGSLHDFDLNLPNLMPGAERIEVQVYSLSDHPDVSPDHALQLFVNGVPSGEARWDGSGEMLQLGFDVPAGALRAGSNLIELHTPAIPGVDNQIVLLYSISANYEKALRGPGEVHVPGNAAGTANRVYEVSGLDTEALWVVDGRTPDAASLLAYQTRVEGDGSITARFAVNGGPWGTGNGFLVVPRGQERLPDAVTERLIEPAPEVQYLAVGPSHFTDAVQPLLEARADHGLSTAFVDQEAIFDAYGFGRYGPEPIRAAVRTIRPRFLLLLGRSTYDYLDREVKGVDPSCPTFLAATSSFAEAPCDALFGDLGNGYSEVAVGRMPVWDASELRVAIERTLSYQVQRRGVRGRGLLVADGLAPEDPDFHAASDALARQVRKMRWRKAYLGTPEFPDADAITQTMSSASGEGADLVLFVGHGSTSRLSKSLVMTVDKAAGWSGNTVLLQATCTANYFVSNRDGHHSIAGTLLTQEQGGICASIAATTWAPGETLNAFMTDLLNASRVPGTTWGEAVMVAQRKSHERTLVGWDQRVPSFADLSRSECLLGDPALRANGVAPDFTSPPERTENRAPAALVSASPIQGVAPLEVSFDGGGSSDPDGTLVSYGWSFGDGTDGRGAALTHTYTVPGTYLARLTVMDDAGASDTATVRIVVRSAQSSPPEDGSASSERLALKRFVVRLRFDVSGRDLVRIVGVLTVPDGFAADEKNVRIDVGGVVREFMFDARGRARAGGDRFRIRTGRRGNSARFDLFIRRGDLASALEDEGLVDADTRQQVVEVPVIVEMGGVTYLWGTPGSRQAERLKYSARKGLMGVAKLLKGRRSP